ncbi:MAG: DNA-directed DNA polymerase II small subunit [Candidatus Lokiarchaeota archaeon]|nr:DNA-directed DNA polymerase II small subunit [Candidatus Lokiarchaeota archaeon]
MNKKEILEYCLKIGFQISPGVLDQVAKKENPMNYLKNILEKINLYEKVPLVISTDTIESLNGKKNQEFPYIEPVTSKIELKKPDLNSETNNVIHALNKDLPINVEILEDPTGKLLGTGKIEDFISYFRDRYEKLKIILRKQEYQNALTINEAKNRVNEVVKIISIIRDLTKTNSGNYILELEDYSGTISARAYKNNEEIMKNMEHVMLDQVLGITGIIKKSQENEILIIREIAWPNVPLKRNIKTAEFPIFAALISDTHFGSKKFMKKQFQNFIDWLNGNTPDPKYKYFSERIKYLIVAGDIVDGVGVYPSQQEDLEILDIKEQYNYAAEWFNKIPNHVHVIITPGSGHDAVRRALPHPAIPKKYAKSLYNLKNVIMLGNPAYFTLESVKFYVTHGDSFDDLIISIPHLSYEKSTESMVEMLRSRHIAPIYGLKTGIAPEREDHLVIKEVPDVFHTGHSHILDINSYRNILLINSGCFQDQTSYMKEKGIIPKPALVPIINLQTLELTVMNFN